MRKLLIFDLRGVLLDKLHATHVQALPYSAVRSDLVFLRPNAVEALTELSSDFDLALWASGFRRTVEPMLPLFGTVSWKFVWTREVALPDFDRRRNPSIPEDEWAILKDVALVHRHFPEYSPSQIVAIDDGADKLRMHPEQLIVIPSFDATKRDCDCDNVLVRLSDDLRNNRITELPFFFS